MSKRAILIGAMLLFSATASADLVPIGDPIEGDSWVQLFDEGNPSIGPFDLVAVRMTSAGDTFERSTSGVHHGFSVSGWAALYENHIQYPTLASASGPAVTYLTWGVRFAGSSSNPLVFDYVAFNGNSIANTAHAVWGPGWSITNYRTAPSPYWNPDRTDVIPAPGAALLGLIGLGVVARVKRHLA